MCGGGAARQHVRMPARLLRVAYERAWFRLAHEAGLTCAGVIGRATSLRAPSAFFNARAKVARFQISGERVDGRILIERYCGYISIQDSGKLRM
jgi:hypothetical protein